MKAKIKEHLLDKSGLKKTIKRVSEEILGEDIDISNLVIIGMRTRGVHVAERMAKHIFKKHKDKLPLGVLDATFYRDDFRTRLKQPEIQITDIPFSIDNKEVVLVDDVIYTGRTTRAALAALMDYGRPARIWLVCLVDRGHRELPIQPDFVGRKFLTRTNEEIRVKVNEVDGEDGVFLVDIMEE